MDEKEYVPPLKSIRKKCLDCCCGSSEEVKLCTVKSCALYDYRFGKNPFKKRTYTDEQKKEMSERMKKMRAASIDKN